jgi:hypothetical protein
MDAIAFPPIFIDGSISTTELLGRQGERNGAVQVVQIGENRCITLG